MSSLTYSPDQPTDFWLFPKFKMTTKGKYFELIESNHNSATKDPDEKELLELLQNMVRMINVWKSKENI